MTLIDGRGILVNFVRRTVLHYFNFKEKVTDIQFSPDGQFISATTFRQIQIWRTPNHKIDIQFSPFVRYRTYTGHHAEISSLTWAKDSRFFLTASKDLTCRIYSLKSEDKGAASVLAGHRDAVVGAFFNADQEIVCVHFENIP